MPADSYSAMAALGSLINGLEMPNQTISCSIKFFFQNVYYVFFSAAEKNDEFAEPIPKY